jgi:hypothetical protein
MIAAMLILIAMTASKAQEPQTPASQLASMTWFEGVWSGTFGENPFWACYTSPQGGTILSVNKDLTPGQEPCYIEFERFAYDDTSVFLVPYPGGEPHSLKFRLVNFDPKMARATFQNSNNDWPTELTYECTTADSLIITLSGPGPESKTPQVMSARLGLVKGR